MVGIDDINGNTDQNTTIAPKVTTTPKPTPIPTPIPVKYKTLKKGDKNDEVKALQTRLITLKYLKGSADGSFGSNTQTAVSDFQAANGIVGVTRGVADAKTQEKLFSEDAKVNPSEKSKYCKLDYSAVERNPEKYSGAFVYFSGRVIQVTEGIATSLFIVLRQKAHMGMFFM